MPNLASREMSGEGRGGKGTEHSCAVIKVWEGGVNRWFLKLQKGTFDPRHKNASNTIKQTRKFPLFWEI